MQQRIGRMVRVGGAALAVVGCCIALGTPAMACNGVRNTSGGAALSPKIASLRRLGLVEPPAIGGREQAAAKDAAQPQADPLNPSIVGLWQLMDLVDGQSVDISYEIWHGDGTEILIDLTPPAEGNVCIGTWVQTGTLTFKLTHPALNFDMDGNFIGTVMIRSVVTLDRSGDKFTGTDTVDLFDVNGSHTDHFEGQFVGARIKPA